MSAFDWVGAVWDVATGREKKSVSSRQSPDVVYKKAVLTAIKDINTNLSRYVDYLKCELSIPLYEYEIDEPVQFDVKTRRRKWEKSPRIYNGASVFHPARNMNGVGNLRPILDIDIVEVFVSAGRKHTAELWSFPYVDTSKHNYLLESYLISSEDGRLQVQDHFMLNSLDSLVRGTSLPNEENLSTRIKRIVLSN